MKQNGNREYKSDVFCMLLQDKNNALALYNAMNGSHYEDPDLIEICNLEKGVSLSIMNDAAFVLDMNLSIYEHQSSYNPNMPLRNLIYFVSILKKYIEKKDIYGRTLVKIPTPRFAVFYNGTKDERERYELKLSDAFEHPMEEPQIELICEVININRGKNTELLNNCKFLEEYTILVDYVRYYSQEYDLAEAIAKSIDRCIEEEVLKDFLIKRRKEVEKSMVLDYTFERRLEMNRQDAWEEGKAEGKAEGITIGKMDVLVQLAKTGKLSVSDAAECAGMDVEEFIKLMEE
ncbi:MAG: hypothetical protein HUJ70_10940 [Pseudobutyrivibrio sp.]|nr:hypothetical protein [Pseudobutyrivibrio sp.]